MGAATEFVRKSGLTPVLIVGLSLVLLNLGNFMVAALEKLQSKARTTGIDYFDATIFLAGMIVSVSSSIVAFMNQSWGRWSAAREEQLKAEAAVRGLDSETQAIRRKLEEAGQPQPKG